MLYRDQTRIERAAGSAMAYSSNANDELEARRRSLVIAFLPAAAILVAAALVLARLIS